MHLKFNNKIVHESYLDLVQVKETNIMDKLKLLYLLPCFIINTVLAASSFSKLNCAKVFSTAHFTAVEQVIKTPVPEKPSTVQVDHSIISPQAAHTMFHQMQKDVQDIPAVREGFFSQIIIHPDGFLEPVSDPTIDIMNDGHMVAHRWNKIPRIRQALAEVYKNVESLQRVINQVLPETDINISEVVFTFQYRKPSEGWHVDWYNNEYIITTQTFVATKINPNGIIVDEPYGGTEYFILDNNSSASIQFDIHKNPVEHMRVQGFPYTTPTGWLSIHSGVQRIQRLLGESSQYLISPPHRGAQTAMEFRGSLAVRYSKKSNE